MFEAFTLVAGPCLLEEDGLNLEVAHRLARLSSDLDLPVVFKASFDKANRSRLDAPRGPGLEEGLRRLERVRTETGLPLLTDIHEPSQAAAAAEVVDVLQIPAFVPVSISIQAWCSSERCDCSSERLFLLRISPLFLLITSLFRLHVLAFTPIKLG